MKRTALITLLWALSGCGTKSDQPAPASGQPSVGTAEHAATDVVSRDSPSCGNGILTGEGVGKLRIGESVESVRRDCTVVSDTTQLGAEGMPSRIVAVLFPQDTVHAEIVDGKVWRVEIRSPHFSTADSLRVGTSLARLLKSKTPQGMTGEGALFVVSPDHCGLSFKLSDNGPPVLRDPTPAQLSRLPAATRITEILIVGCHK
ncbi:MAG: hypothetical protein ACR2NS_01205 [Gemmatimonadaceae bacterium]